MSCRAVLVVPAFMAACGWVSPEDQVVSQFFMASRTWDTVQLANVAQVALDPRTEGSVQTFTIERMGGESRRPLASPEDDALAVTSLTPPGQPDFRVAGENVAVV